MPLPPDEPDVLADGAAADVPPPAAGDEVLLLPDELHAVTPRPIIAITATIADLSGLVLIVYNLSMSEVVSDIAALTA